MEQSKEKAKLSQREFWEKVMDVPFTVIYTAIVDGKIDRALEIYKGLNPELLEEESQEIVRKAREMIFASI
jgi:hypothetical protein